LQHSDNENVYKMKALTNFILLGLMIFGQYQDSNLKELEIEASRLRGGGSINSVEIIGRKAVVVYVKNYAEYKRINPRSSVTESYLHDYWSTGAGLEKALVDGPVRLLRKLDFIDEVDLTIPFEGKDNRVVVSREAITKFTGHDMGYIKSNWNEAFSDPYVYTENGRKVFLMKFGK
jgi:hypothetical protein